MSKRRDIKKILVIGSGPIVIGQAAEFDYAGTQACHALREEGYQVVLMNSNPATIMSDTSVADKVYMEPLTLEFATRIIYKERPDAILGSLGGQTGLNLVMELAKAGVLEDNNVEVLGTKLTAIEQAEDRDQFRELMYSLNEPVPSSAIVHSIEESLVFANSNGYPVVVRPAYTLGGTGGGFAHDESELISICENGLRASPVNQCLIEQSIAGYKEIEYEVMRDQDDHALVVCNMENIDPVGVHTGDSIVVAPCITLSANECKMMRDSALKIIRALKICGGCNVQLALDPNSFKYYVIEVNPRVSRSSALASKATGYPIAKIAAKVAVGMRLDEIINPLTNECAAYEPCIDYQVVKFPRFAFDKFPKADRSLGTQMKATGEVMSMGRTFHEALLKAVRSLEMKCDHLQLKHLSKLSDELLWKKMLLCDDERIFAIAELFRRKDCLEEVHEATKIDRFFLRQIKAICDIEQQVINNVNDLAVLKIAKKHGFADSYIATLWNLLPNDIANMRKSNGIIPVFKMVDTCSGTLDIVTPYLYSTYEQVNESIPSKEKKIIVLGSGPIRIGQGVEFDYATVHCVQTIRKCNYEAIVINNNPETVSTDFTISDKLYFEPLTVEDVMHVIDLEQPIGVVVQFGGQTAINLAQDLMDLGVKILGTSVANIDKAEDRNEFEKMLKQLDIPQPNGETAITVEKALKIANRITYPILIRPSYVLGGRAMEIVHKDEDLKVYMENAVKEISHDAPILIDKYIVGKEIEIDAIADGVQVYIPGIMEHIEKAGVHSGDSISAYPAFSISQKVKNTIVEYTKRIGVGFNFIGLFNIQFIVDKAEKVYVLEVNPRSSRTIPFLSKITHLSMVDMATRCILGETLAQQGVKEDIKSEPKRFYIKAPVFSFSKLHRVDTTLGPEMKSTGEAIGSDQTFEKALYKALLASGIRIPTHGNILVTIADQNKDEGYQIAMRFQQIGYGLYATRGTAKYLNERGLYVRVVDKINENVDNNVVDAIRRGKVNYVVNTMSTNKTSSQDGFLIRRAAAENNIPCFTSLDTARAILLVLESQCFDAMSMQELEQTYGA